MDIDIQIDRFTDCLFDTWKRQTVVTEYYIRTTPIRPKDYRGWRFNWSTTEKMGYHIYELFVKGDPTVQGRISVKGGGGVVDVDIAETAPHNYGHTGRYEGVGAHLFAIACKVSLDVGYDGFVTFTSKSDLVEYYHEKLGARVFRDRRMYIDEQAAQILLDKYIRK